MAFNNINSIDDVNKTLEVPEKESKISELNKIQENNQNDKNLIKLYQKFYNQEIEPKKLLEILDISYQDEWLLRFEIYKNSHQIKEEWVLNLNKYLNSYKESNIDLNNAIKRGLNTI